MLGFRADGTFTIVQLTDLHWQDGAAEDAATSVLVDAILEAERPDLVVFTGDVIAGSGCADPAWSLRQAVKPAVDRALPWALVFGNHDDEGRLGRTELMAVATALPGCLAEPGPGDIPGVGNYRLDVLGGDGAPAARLYFLDSGSYAPKDIGGYAWITHEQAAWYRAQGRTPEVAALAFFHIPLPEFGEVWDAGGCRGVRYESVCSPKVNSGFFCTLREADEVRGVFVGHDHVNDYDGDWHGIRLCYGRATGFHTYGREGMPRGARVIRLHQGRRGFDTWLRLEGGVRVDQNML